MNIMGFLNYFGFVFILGIYGLMIFGFYWVIKLAVKHGMIAAWNERDGE